MNADRREVPHIKIYGLGSNGSGQLGIGHHEDVSAPTALLKDPDVSFGKFVQRRGLNNVIKIYPKIACGGNHTTILARDHSLSATGYNGAGQCLLECQSTCCVKRIPYLGSVDDPLPCDQIAATWNATFSVRHGRGVSDTGETCVEATIYIAGTGNSGELGLGRDITTIHKPASITFNTGIEKIAAGMGHVIVVLSNGEVWGWGKGRQGQLGEPAENIWEPRKIQGITWHAYEVVCGKDFTCVFGEPGTQQYLVLGPNRNDRFGVKANAPASLPLWKQVGASWGSIFVLSENGELIGWGRNDHGQLPPSDLPPLEMFAAGSEHCLGLTKTGKVLAWGWSEHGNCGELIDADGDVKGRYNELPLSHAACAVFAGCATSFIATVDDREG